jgi:hypothetical protein
MVSVEWIDTVSGLEAHLEVSRVQAQPKSLQQVARFSATWLGSLISLPKADFSYQSAVLE